MAKKPTSDLFTVQEQEKEPIAKTSTSDLFTVREVARRLCIDDTTVRRWIKSGAIEALTLPHRGKRESYRIKATTLASLLQAPPTTQV